MDERSPLGEFLQARRARTTPADVGLRLYGDRRRVPGLRREELAMLAGVSVGYYTRLEQGQSLNASPEVLNALASALQLSTAERDHLHLLSSARSPARTAIFQEEITDSVRTLVASMTMVPALVMGRHNDVLAWNRAGHALFAGHLDFDLGARPNMSRLVFLDAHTRALYRDWPAKARAVVGNLRIMTARYPGDEGLAALVGGLAIESPEFARLWADHTIQPCGSDDFDLSHPLVGDLTITQQTLTIPQDSHQTLVTATTVPGSPSESALLMLQQLTGSR